MSQKSLKKECENCEKAFSNRNVFTPAGWKEAQISGLCEICFDFAFAENDGDVWVRDNLEKKEEK